MQAEPTARKVSGETLRLWENRRTSSKGEVKETGPNPDMFFFSFLHSQGTGIQSTFCTRKMDYPFLTACPRMLNVSLWILCLLFLIIFHGPQAQIHSPRKLNSAQETSQTVPASNVLYLMPLLCSVQHSMGDPI